MSVAKECVVIGPFRVQHLNVLDGSFGTHNISDRLRRLEQLITWAHRTVKV